MGPWETVFTVLQDAIKVQVLSSVRLSIYQTNGRQWEYWKRWNNKTNHIGSHLGACSIKCSITHLWNKWPLNGTILRFFWKSIVPKYSLKSHSIAHFIIVMEMIKNCRFEPPKNKYSIFFFVKQNIENAWIEPEI